jgi:coenzyme F420 biosynthesis associated uncharacterized protein
MTTPVDWDLAARLGARLAERGGIVVPAKLARLEADFAEHTSRAEALVEEATGLRSSAGPARARVVDRADWVRANVASFQRLLRPLTDKVGEQLGASGKPGPLNVARRVTGAEVGLLLGWMSGRVLGQYDLLVIEGEDLEHQDLVYYVGPNVLALEERFGFSTEQFRLWLALHEVTHRAQFTGVPWMRGHFLSLIEQVVGGIDPNPQQFLESLKRAAGAVRNGGRALQDGGLAAVFATPEQKAVLDRIGGMMSLLEGHGDVTMDRAGHGLLPEAERFGRILKERRSQKNPAARLAHRLIGLEAKLNQYEQGERFLAAIEEVGGLRAVDRAWESPENLPTIEEIREPQRWLDRVGLAA